MPKSKAVESPLSQSFAYSMTGLSTATKVVQTSGSGTGIPFREYAVISIGTTTQDMTVPPPEPQRLVKVIMGEYGSGQALNLIPMRALSLLDFTQGTHLLYTEENVSYPLYSFSQDFFDNQHQVVVSQFLLMNRIVLIRRTDRRVICYHPTTSRQEIVAQLLPTQLRICLDRCPYRVRCLILEYKCNKIYGLYLLTPQSCNLILYYKSGFDFMAHLTKPTTYNIEDSNIALLGSDVRTIHISSCS